MEMRVVPADEASVAPTERLRVAVGSERISVNGDGREVGIGSSKTRTKAFLTS